MYYLLINITSIYLDVLFTNTIISNRCIIY